MNIAICDDEEKICGILIGMVRDILPEEAVRTYTSGAALLAATQLPDILLLDILMPDMGGMEAAERLRAKGWQGILIFVTGEEAEVFHAFDLHAFHFLVKPVVKEKLREVLLRAKEELFRLRRTPESRDREIQIQSGTTHIRVRLSQLIYAEVYDRKTILHTTKDSIEYYGQLSALSALVGKDFYRVHRSYLVHMKYVERYDRTSVTVRGGAVVPIARREYEGFLKAYMDYSRGRIGS